MKNVLIPTDFSNNAWNAISYTLNYFEKEHCNFYILHVNTIQNISTSEVPYLPTQSVIEESLKPAKKQLRLILKRISEEFTDNKKHKFYTLTDYNFFIESIRKHVAEKKIDLIVMGTKGASGLKELIVGSNTGDVIKKVACNTLVIPEKATFSPLNEIAFPTDFSLSYSIETLQPLYEIIETTNSTLRILNINKNNTELNADQQENKDLIEDYFSNQFHSFHFLTNRKVEDAVQFFTESRNINMIAMVAKNLNYFQQILFHSKVEKISYHIEIPFLVLHE